MYIYASFPYMLLEYLTSFVMEYVWKMRWWNYSGAFNVNGRINLMVIAVFGCIGLLFHYVVIPNMGWIRVNLAMPLRSVITIMMLLFVADFVYAQIHPNIASISSHRPF